MHEIDIAMEGQDVRKGVRLATLSKSAISLLYRRRIRGIEFNPLTEMSHQPTLETPLIAALSTRVPNLRCQVRDTRRRVTWVYSAALTNRSLLDSFCISP